METEAWGCYETATSGGRLDFRRSCQPTPPPASSPPPSSPSKSHNGIKFSSPPFGQAGGLVDLFPGHLPNAALGGVHHRHFRQGSGSLWAAATGRQGAHPRSAAATPPMSALAWSHRLLLLLRLRSPARPSLPGRTGHPPPPPRLRSPAVVAAAATRTAGGAWVVAVGWRLFDLPIDRVCQVKKRITCCKSVYMHLV